MLRGGHGRLHRRRVYGELSFPSYMTNKIYIRMLEILTVRLKVRDKFIM